MLHKGKLAVFIFSTIFIIYGIGAAFYGKVVKDDAYPALSVFMHALDKIHHDYVQAPDMSKVQEGAMRGLVGALDPYSAFLSKEQVGLLAKRAENEAGIGVALSKRAEIIYVVAINRNGPADRSGLRPGDYLISIDGIGVEDKSIIEAESLLSGAEGSKVKLVVFRNARTKPVEIEVERQSDAAVRIASRMLEEGIGWIDVPSLAGEAAGEIRRKLKTLISAGAERLILDLRDCAAGEPSAGAEVTNLFFREGLIYTSKNRDGVVVRETKANPDRYVTDLPLAILVNGSTAGAAEIVAAALKDHDRAKLVGEKTFGLGSMQKKIALKSGAMIVISTAKFFTPGGRMKTEKYRELREKIRDEQLNKALEVVKGETGLDKAA